jgi:hypothetical protein
MRRRIHACLWMRIHACHMRKGRMLWGGAWSCHGSIMAPLMRRRRRIHACHMRSRRIHACHMMRRRIHGTWCWSIMPPLRRFNGVTASVREGGAVRVRVCL